MSKIILNTHKDNNALVEEKFQQYIQAIKEIYPEQQKNKSPFKELVETYQGKFFHENIMVALFDNRTASMVFISENIKKITGYKASTLNSWKGLFLFKVVHPTHYTFPFTSIRNERRFHRKLAQEEKKDAIVYCGGLKLVHGDGKERFCFLKMKNLTWTENNQPDISIIFAEDVSHLMKGRNYWLRHTAQLKKQAYVHQRGKKHFSDLISDSEKKVLELLANKKTNAEIADELCLSKLTVETHRKNMIKRVGAVNSTALVHLCKMANII